MLLVIAFIVLAILGIRFPKSKGVFLLILLFMWVLFAFNYLNADYEVYMVNYTKISTGDFRSFESSEIGFVQFSYLCSRLGCSYQQFLEIYSAICTLILGYLITCLSKRPNSVLVLFILNPYWVMIVQIRYYMAFLIVVLGLTRMIKKTGMQGIFEFIICVLLSGLFHRAGWLCIILVLAKIKDIRKITWITIAATASLLIFRTSFGMSIASHFISQRKINTWLAAEGSRSFVGVSLLLIVRVAMLILAFYMYRRINENERVDEKTKEKALTIVKLIMIGFVFVGLEVFNKNYERFFRVSLTLLYVLFCDYLESNSLYYKEKKLLPVGELFAPAITLTYYAFFFFSFRAWFSNSLIPVLSYNLLIDSIK